MKAIASLSLRSGSDIPSPVAIYRHKTRHLLITNIANVKPAPADFKVEPFETVADEKSIHDSMIYSIMDFDPEQFQAFQKIMSLYSCQMPLILTVQNFEAFLLQLVDQSVPSKHDHVRDRYRQYISKYYPQNGAN